MTHWAHTKSVKRTQWLAMAFIWAVCMVGYLISPAVFASTVAYIAACALVRTTKLEVEVFPEE